MIDTMSINSTTPSDLEKTMVKETQETASYCPSVGNGEVSTPWENTIRDLKETFLTKDGWVGDYDYLYLITPNIWPLNKKYKDYTAPFYGLHDKVPLLLTIILGLQHALTMIGSIVSPPLAIAGGAFNFDPAMTEYLVSTAFITTGFATALQVTRVHLAKSQFYIGTGLLSVVGPTFDILPICFNYAAMRYKAGTCPVSPDGTQLPCPDAWGAILGRFFSVPVDQRFTLLTYSQAQCFAQFGFKSSCLLYRQRP
jgi:hypothetical protein